MPSLDKLLPFLIARLTERSTVVTIITLVAGVVGADLLPEHKETIATAVMSVVSAVAIFWGTDHPAA